ncbi:unnamed protein product [Darwinula stevensoni]|uniref:Uncharacterized protein n=1 Tax=Darwinula stevensoni TaxID=69355 RepID=A0A7R9AJK8_9CRUS|nr:unnamed protein product [Darwinula stevensoni]CAG0907615.1 unnamed protein product [Darwinula stevensoni]
MSLRGFLVPPIHAPSLEGTTN